MNKKFYIILEKADDYGYCIFIPELNLATEAKDLDSSFEMAYDCIASTLCAYEDENMEIPFETFDVSKVKPNQTMAVVDVNTEEYRKNIINKSKKVTLTIPEYLYKEALNLKLNKSKLLQKAILSEINKNKISK